MAKARYGLNEKDVETLNFIIEYEKVKLFPPTLREIAQATGIRSTSSIFMRIRKLEDFGHLSIDDVGRITLNGYTLQKTEDIPIITNFNKEEY